MPLTTMSARPSEIVKRAEHVLEGCIDEECVVIAECHKPVTERTQMLNERLGGAVQQIELVILDHDDVRPQ